MGEDFKSIVVPAGDIRPHIDSVHCWCGARVIDDVLVHNAFDGRDRVEAYDEAMGTDGKYGRHSHAVALGYALLEGCELVDGISANGNTYTFEKISRQSGKRFKAVVAFEEV